MSDFLSGVAGGDGSRLILERLIDLASVVVVRVTLEPGAEMEPHRHKNEYVTVPLADAKLLRVVRRGDRVVEEIPLELRMGEPYHVGPTKRGYTISIRNTGTEPSRWVKVIIRPPSAPRSSPSQTPSRGGGRGTTKPPGKAPPRKSTKTQRPKAAPSKRPPSKGGQRQSPSGRTKKGGSR